LIAVTDGTLTWATATNDFAPPENTPLPVALKGRFTAEPKWVDLTAYRDGADKRDARFTELAADFAAAIRGMPKEDLLSQEVKQQRRALTLAWSAAGLLLVLAGLAVWQWKTALDNERAAIEQKQIAQQQRDRAERTLAAASRTANDLVLNLAAEFRDRRGMPIDLVRNILGRAEGLQQQLVSAGETSPDLRYAEGAGLNELAITLQILGDMKDALATVDRAIANIEALAAEFPANANYRRDTGISYQTRGNVLRRLGRREEALESYRKSVSIFERLVSDQPMNQQWQGYLAGAYGLVGETLKLAGERQQALEFLRRGLTIQQKLADANPTNGEMQRAMSVSYMKIGDVLFLEGKLADALEAFRASLAITEKIAATDPENAKWQDDLTIDNSRIGDVLRDQ